MNSLLGDGGVANFRLLFLAARLKKSHGNILPA
jgi:hypothetical protein